MRWLLAIMMVISLWAEGGVVSYADGEVKQICCCGQDRPICPPTRNCSTVTIVPRIVQERTVTQSTIKLDIKRVAFPLKNVFSSDSKNTSGFSDWIHATWCERFSAAVSLHDALLVWRT